MSNESLDFVRVGIERMQTDAQVDRTMTRIRLEQLEKRVAALELGANPAPAAELASIERSALTQLLDAAIEARTLCKTHGFLFTHEMLSNALARFEGVR